MILLPLVSRSCSNGALNISSNIVSYLQSQPTDLDSMLSSMRNQLPQAKMLIGGRFTTSPGAFRQSSRTKATYSSARCRLDYSKFSNRAAISRCQRSCGETSLSITTNSGIPKAILWIAAVGRTLRISIVVDSICPIVGV